MEKLYGVESSPTLSPTITEAVLEIGRIWQSRPLETGYPILYVECRLVKSCQDGVVTTKVVYVVMGVTLQEKELFGLWASNTERAKFWMGVFTDLQQQGDRIVSSQVLDGLKGGPETVETVFPRHRGHEASFIKCARRSGRASGTSGDWWCGIAWDHFGREPLQDAQKRACEAFATIWDATVPTLSARVDAGIGDGPPVGFD